MSLPVGYKRLKHIRPNGNAWINTGVVGKASIVMEFRARLAGSTSAKNVLSETYHSGSDTVVCPWRSAGGMFQACWGGSYTDLFASDNEWHTIKAAQGYVEVDGKRYTVAGTSSTTATMPLFAEVYAGTPQAYGDFELEYAKYWLDEVQVRDYIACETDTGEVGLWDNANSVFYGNAGSGTFLAGDVVEYHKALISGVEREIEAGTALVGGVGCEIEYGTALVNGVAVTIPFATSSGGSTNPDEPEGEAVTVTLDFSMPKSGVITVTIGGVEYTGYQSTEIEVPSGTTITITGRTLVSLGTLGQGTYHVLFDTDGFKQIETYDDYTYDVAIQEDTTIKVTQSYSSYTYTIITYISTG